MTAGYIFPYRPIQTRLPAIHTPSRYDAPSCDDGRPVTYDSKRRTVDCVIASNSRIHHRFGLLVLRISEKAVDLNLIDSGLVPVLDAHDYNRVLGHVVGAWFEEKELRGTLHFDKSPAGLHAADKVRRGEISAVSAGVTISRWVDAAGNPVTDAMLNNPHFTTWGDGNPEVFTAQRWTLNEVSLTTGPADKEAVIL